MARGYQLNDHYGVVLTDSGDVIPISNSGPVDPQDSAMLLQLLLAAAVELDHIRGENSG